jgi:hypothetical protein
MHMGHADPFIANFSFRVTWYFGMLTIIQYIFDNYISCTNRDYTLYRFRLLRVSAFDRKSSLHTRIETKIPPLNTHVEVRKNGFQI